MQDKVWGAVTLMTQGWRLVQARTARQDMPRGRSTSIHFSGVWCQVGPLGRHYLGGGPTQFSLEASSGLTATQDSQVGTTQGAVNCRNLTTDQLLTSFHQYLNICTISDTRPAQLNNHIKQPKILENQAQRLGNRGPKYIQKQTDQIPPNLTFASPRAKQSKKEN